MTQIEIHKNGKVEKTIDLTPVEEITNNLEKILRKRESWEDRSHVKYHIEILDKIKELDKDQLEYLVNNLVGIIGRYAELYQNILDNPEKECQEIKKYKDFFKLMQEQINSKN